MLAKAAMWRSLRTLAGVAWFFVLAACGSSEEAGSAATVDGGQSPSAEAGICVPQPCACSSGPGTQRCNAGGQLGNCECPVPVATTPDAAVINVGSCPTGVYEGNFEGEAGFLFALGPVSGLDLFDERPPLQITLSPLRGEEFAVSGNGVMRGNANGTFPFEATITGKLQCETKRFQATLVGSVQLVLDGVRNDFTGTMESSYDSDARAFAAGTWTVTGSDADGGFDLGLSGSGSWSARHAGDGGP